MLHYQIKIKFKFQKRLQSILNRFFLCPSYPLSTLSRNDFVPFDSMVEQRRKQAQKSLVVEVPINQEGTHQILHSICSNFGSIEKMFEYSPSTNNNIEQKMVLLEFEEEESLSKIVERSQMNSIKMGMGMGIQLPFLNLSKQANLSNQHPINNQYPINNHAIIQTSNHLSQSQILHHMKHNCQNISEQIQYFYDQQKMTEVGWRLRFMTCRKIEWLLPRILSHIKVLPFGSSVNSFGNYNCDLDMVIDMIQQQSEKTPKVDQFPLQVQNGNRAYHNSVQRNLELFADLMKIFMPGFTQVIKVLHANVPIIKCIETFTGLECDLTINNKSGYYMSELLYIYGCADPRVRPLVFSIRLWSKQKQITLKMKPGRSVSNFSITLLVLFYLMNTKPYVIPPIKVLEGLSGDSFIVDGIKYSYLRDITKLPPSENKESLEELLRGFFNFYASFNFNKKAISLISGTHMNKPTFSPLYIQNPTETNLNVSRNVNSEELESLQKECLNACYAFDHLNIQTYGNSNGSNWGLNSLVTKQRLNESSKGTKNGSSIIDIKSIFEDTPKDETASLQEKAASLQEKAASLQEKAVVLQQEILTRKNMSKSNSNAAQNSKKSFLDFGNYNNSKNKKNSKNRSQMTRKTRREFSPILKF